MQAQPGGGGGAGSRAALREACGASSGLRAAGGAAPEPAALPRRELSALQIAAVNGIDTVEVGVGFLPFFLSSFPPHPTPLPLRESGRAVPATTVPREGLGAVRGEAKPSSLKGDFPRAFRRGCPAFFGTFDEKGTHRAPRRSALTWLPLPNYSDNNNHRPSPRPAKRRQTGLPLSLRYKQRNGEQCPITLKWPRNGTQRVHREGQTRTNKDRFLTLLSGSLI